MKIHRQLSALVLGLLMALTVTITGASDRPGIVFRGERYYLEVVPVAPVQQASCSKMQATSDVFWYETDEEGEFTDEQVESYPSGTAVLAASFDYNCVPKGVSIVTVWALDGEVIFSDKTTQKASNKEGSYSYTLFREDGEALPDGEWEVGFFNNKTELVTGAITVGGGGGEEPIDGEPVTIQGTVTDAKTKKPIKGALVIVLNEGIAAEDFVEDPQDEDVYTAATTNARGEFVLENPVDREGTHSWIIAAKGYKPVLEDEVVIGADAEDPVELNIELSK